MAKAQHRSPISTEEAVRWLISQPNSEAVVSNNYLESDIMVAAERFWRSEEFVETKRVLRIRPGLRVLEIGAGWGIASWAFAKEGCIVTAVEPDKSDLIGTGAMRRLIQKSGVSFNIVDGFGENITESDFYDVVYVRQVLHHVHDLGNFCCRAARVLKPGGRFLATREPVISKRSDLERFLNDHPVHHLTLDENAYLKSEYLAAFTKAGLAVVKTWGMRESPINSFPIPRDHTMGELVNALGRRIGHKSAKLLLRLPAIYTYCARRRDAVDDTPGRHLTILAKKG